MNLEKMPGSKVKFEVVIPVDTFKKAVDEAFAKKIKEVEVPGFRKGQAPRSVYEAKYGVESLYDEALNTAISETYYEAVSENNIDACGYPKIDLDTKKISQEEPIHYTVNVSVFPEVELGEYKGLEVVKDEVKVLKKDVDAEIKNALSKDAMMITKEDQTIALGDTAKFDFEGSVDGVLFEGGTAKDYTLEIGSGQFIPGFEEQMVGLKVGDVKDLNVKFPEDYHAENLKGKDAVFKVTIHEVQTKEVPELTEEWAKEQKHTVEGKEVAYESVEEYRKDVQERIKTERENNAQNKALNELFDKVVKNAKFELPEDLVEDEVQQEVQAATNQAKQYGLDLQTLLMYSGVPSVEEYKANVRKQAVERLSLRFVLKAIAAKENIEVSNEELEDEYKELADHYQMSVDQIKNSVPESAVKEEVQSKKAYKLIEDENPFKKPVKKTTKKAEAKE
ncbi:MAG: trigger factor [Gammaproteobacteria bacterium]|nr:trigger factor [Gammaproteobacteria bacterium]